jgi:mRNA turnover protein 4
MVEKVRDLVEKFSSVILLEYSNFKTSSFQQVREQWPTSKFILGKAKVLQKALGTSPETSPKPNLYQLSEVTITQNITGNSGLLFTNEDVSRAIEFFTFFSEDHYLHPGQVATDEVVIPAGVGTFTRFSNTIEPYLRQLGLPTRLHEGQIEMLRSFTVCTAGQTLTSEQAKILRLLDSKLGSFRIQLKGLWSEGNYRELNE